jgi:hypothetical protein
MKEEKPQLLAFDTEDNSVGGVQVINFFDGERHTTFTGQRCQVDARHWLRGQPRSIVWACNLEYDLCNLFGAWVGKMVTLEYISSGLMKASYRDGPITFYDTMRHWPASVEQMGVTIGLPKMKMDFTDRWLVDPQGNATARPYCGDHSLAELVPYCQRDTEIVWRFTDGMLKRYEADDLQLRPTLPSMTLQFFKKRWHKRDWVQLPLNLIDFFREGYYGGRVEVYKMGQVDGTIHHYDVNSLFPSVMLGGRFPDLREWSVRRDPDWSRDGMATVRIRVPQSFYPAIPTRANDEVVFPYGVLRGTWTYPEIRQVLADGGAIVEVLHAVEFSRWHRPFDGYIRYCYDQRLRSTTDLDKVYWKLMMNSFYGKFGQDTEGLVMIHKDREFKPKRALAPHVNVIWSAYVTAYARLRLLELLRSTGEKAVYYTDTDSLFTPKELATGSRLGQLKEEATWTRTQFLGNKLYILGLDDHEEAKAKGVPRGSAADFIRTGRAIFKRPVRYRESRRNYVQANTWVEYTKDRDKPYTKRRLLGTNEGWTEPWEWEAYKRYTSKIPRHRLTGHQLELANAISETRGGQPITPDEAESVAEVADEMQEVYGSHQ